MIHPATDQNSINAKPVASAPGGQAPNPESLQATQRDRGDGRKRDAGPGFDWQLGQGKNPGADDTQPGKHDKVFHVEKAVSSPTANLASQAVCWASWQEVTALGNGLGYQGASAAFARTLAGRNLLDNEAPVAVHFCNPHDFKPISGKKNVLFTMTETAKLAGYYVEKGIRQADALLVPSRFCADVFKPALAGKPMARVPLGFDPEAFPYRRRTWAPGKPFRFLWCGAPNARKGWDLTVWAWRLFHVEQWASLYLKTTDETGTGGRLLSFPHRVTFDSRMLQGDTYRELFESAHCLLAPSTGEGFGLVMLEAMASGLPVVSVRYGGQRDFLGEDAWYAATEARTVMASDGTEFVGAFATQADLARQMGKVAKHYGQATTQAAKAAKRAHESWTWDDATDALLLALARFQRRWSATA